MSNENFLEELRGDARQLRYEPDDATWTRLQARVRERIAAHPTVAQLLAAWLRPVGASLAALSLVAALSATWLVQTRDTATVDSMASSSVEVSVGGDTYSVTD